MQNGPQHLWKPSPHGFENPDQEEYPIGFGARSDGLPQGPARKNPKNNIDQKKKRAAPHRVPPFWRKMWPTWLQLGFQDGAKMEKKAMQKSIKNLMPLGIDFRKDLEGFWEPKWSHVGTQIDQKSMWFAKSGFSKNRCFSLGKTTIFKVRGVQVGSKNRSKID